MTKPVYRIHPAIGIARLGNSPSEFYLAPEETGALPTICDGNGNPVLDEKGDEQPVDSFKDSQGRIKRQAARFRVFVYDEDNPQGRELQMGDQIVGVESRGKLVDVEWTVYPANKKAIWYEFKQLEGEHGYDDKHPLRNASITDQDDRLQLVIDPGPQTINCTGNRSAQFARGKNANNTQTFPPPLQPSSIDTLGEMMTNSSHHLIFLGGYGNSGCWSKSGGPVGPVIRNYANNDGWFDDVSDGPVMAILKFHSDEDNEDRYVEVESPAWVVVGYPRFAPQIVDMITMDELIYDLGVREFAYNTYIYGTGDFDNPPQVDASHPDALQRWRNTQGKRWNRDYYPYFWKEIWPILSRPDRMQWVTDFLAISSDPHEIGAGGNFELGKISVPPKCSDAPGCAGNCEGPCREDPYRDMRQYIYAMLRKPGEENFLSDPFMPERNRGNPLMPLLCGDNPLSDTLTSKFLRLTETMLFLIRQWADGKFINEQMEGIDDARVEQPAGRGIAIDRGVLGNVLGGSFCPGGELGWIMRNPGIYLRPYRLKAREGFFPRSASGRKSGQPPFSSPGLDLDENLDLGIEPGDLTKHMALPWQADFNECATQPVDVSYVLWATPKPSLKTNVTLWWPSHRPMQVYRRLPTAPDKGARYQQIDWARGIPETDQGDLKMVTAWSGLGFVVANPDPTSLPQYVEVEAHDDAP